MSISAEDALSQIVALGINEIEMMWGTVEAFAGAPPGPPLAGANRGAPVTPEQQEARRKATAEIRDWRLAASMDKFKALRKMYNDAGVNIYALKPAYPESMLNEEEQYDYGFTVAKALGANHITMELGDRSARIAPYAEKHQIPVAFHNHTTVKFHDWDATLAQSKFLGINFDAGHYVAGGSESPIPFLKQYHDRILSLHLKDRKSAANGNVNMPWGQGDTPIVEILHWMQREKYRFPATIELEYPTPAGSTAMAELTKCIRICKDALSVA